MPLLGVIGGSGVYDMPDMEITETVKVVTPYGHPSDSYRIGRLAGAETAFLPRHGADHRLQPNKINYRANLWGFRELGVGKVISVCAAGGINPEVSPGSIVLPDQIIDMTSGRASTFYDEDEVVHIDFTNPFCQDLRGQVTAASAAAGIFAITSGVYISVNGPRLETAAEIRTFAAWGADMVGMTLMPEASLARELGMCFTCIAVVTNFAAGIAAKKLTAKEVLETMKTTEEKLRSLLGQLFLIDLRPTRCSCRQSLEDARL
jgi:5'-methylthioadenosine phosphorylase